MEFIIKEFKNKNLSIYATSDTIEDFITENNIVLDEDGEDFDILGCCDYAILSKNIFKGEEWWILEGLISSKQYSNETEVLIIENDILDIVDLDKITADKIIVFGCKKECECYDEEAPEIVEEILNEVLEELEHEEECPHCIIKQGLLTAYNIGRKDGLLDAVDRIEELF